MEIIGLIKSISQLKRVHGFEIVDSHVHPLDVMGILDRDAYDFDKVINSFDHKYYTSPTAIEIFRYGRVANLLSQQFCNFFPNKINNELANSFHGISEERLLKEMDIAGVDRCALIPIEPWSETTQLCENFRNDRFFRLASLDVHSIPIEAIEPALKEYKQKYKVVGIKMHPNLQNFYPQPSNNETEVKEKLLKIYRLLGEMKLYLVIHGGKSFFTKRLNPTFKGKVRSRFNALLENYITEDGGSEIFDNCDCPIIISHLGHYGTLSFDLSLIKKISKRYKNIYFDTAGSSPKYIRKMLYALGNERMIFGSDAIYNRMAYNLVFLYLAIRSYYRASEFVHAFSNVVNLNFLRVIS